MVHTQKMIAESYGFEKTIPLDYSVTSKGKTVEAFKLAKKDISSVSIVENNIEPCAMCGVAHATGYKSNVSGAHLMSAMISGTYNECYSLKANNFICEFCGFNMISYGSPAKSPFGRKMLNSVVGVGSREDKYFNSDKDNELYGILKNPPKIPFVILINSRGTVLENLTFTAKATLSKEWVIVNYGLENLEVEPKAVFDAIEDARTLSSLCGVEVSSDHIWNRQNDVQITPNRQLSGNEVFWKEIGLFLFKYNRDVRIVAKMILAAYLKDNKNSRDEVLAQKLPETAGVKTSGASTSLFDF